MLVRTILRQTDGARLGRLRDRGRADARGLPPRRRRADPGAMYRRPAAPPRRGGCGPLGAARRRAGEAGGMRRGREFGGRRGRLSGAGARGAHDVAGGERRAGPGAATGGPLLGRADVRLRGRGRRARRGGCSYVGTGQESEVLLPSRVPTEMARGSRDCSGVAKIDPFTLSQTKVVQEEDGEHKTEAPGTYLPLIKSRNRAICDAGIRDVVHPVSITSLRKI